MVIASFLTCCMLFAENAKRVPDVEDVPGRKGIELSRTPVELKGGDWVTKVVPWIGGRIISMTHIPSGNNSNIVGSLSLGVGVLV